MNIWYAKDWYEWKIALIFFKLDAYTKIFLKGENGTVTLMVQMPVSAWMSSAATDSSIIHRRNFKWTASERKLSLMTRFLDDANLSHMMSVLPVTHWYAAITELKWANMWLRAPSQYYSKQPWNSIGTGRLQIIPCDVNNCHRIMSANQIEGRQHPLDCVFHHSSLATLPCTISVHRLITLPSWHWKKKTSEENLIGQFY